MAYHQIHGNRFFIPNGEINNLPKHAPSPWMHNMNQKPRLRWTSELHEVFVAAVTLLGGPEEAKPTAINQTMERLGVFGLTLRQVKSHLQKYRTSCKSGKERSGQQLSEVTEKKVMEGPSFAHPSPPPTTTTATVPILGRGSREQGLNNVEMSYSDIGMGLIQEQMEIEKHLQVRKDAHGKYLDSLLDRAIDRAVWEFFNV